jgi:protoporphyrinogen oxidase
MKEIAIIGAGFTGLSAALQLCENDYSVTIFEKENQPGGLAGGFTRPNWKNSLEFHYHHFFTNDKFGTDLMKKVDEKYAKYSPVTSVLIDGKILRFDSPLSLASFPLLSILEKIRLAVILAIFKIIPESKINPVLNFFKTKTSSTLIPKLIGQKTYNMLFSPLFKSKFGTHEKEISAIWFWARINKRTTKLIYPDGGYQKFAQKLLKSVEDHGTKTRFDSTISEIKKDGDKWKITTNKDDLMFDQVLFTTPFPVTRIIFPDFPTPEISHLDSLNLVLETKRPILEKEYWLNINDPDYPFLALIQHTNLVNRNNYGDNYISYVGNYLPRDHDYYQKSADELVEIYLPKIQKINPNFKKSDIINSFLFHGYDAQPVVTIDYENRIPEIDLSKLKSEYEGLFIANMDMVFPWDRGVNYAIELGYEAASVIARSE